MILHRCRATTQAGSQCRRTAHPDLAVCAQHADHLVPDHYCEHEDQVERLIALLEHWANEGRIGLTARQWREIAGVLGVQEDPA